MRKTTPTNTSRNLTAPKAAALPSWYADVRSSIVELLNAARQAAARNVNALMTASYWEIGRRIVEAEQKGKRRAGYGEQLIERLSQDLTQAFGRGFSARNLEQMRQFYLTLSFAQTVSAQMSWSELANALRHHGLAYMRLLSTRSWPRTTDSCCLMLRCGKWSLRRLGDVGSARDRAIKVIRDRTMM
jgi:DUF1016 N-terminal domain